MKFELGDVDAKLLSWHCADEISDKITIVCVAFLNIPLKHLSVYDFCMRFYFNDEDINNIANGYVDEDIFSSAIDTEYIALYSDGRASKNEFPVELTKYEKDIIIKLISERFKEWYIENAIL